jgi:hypothetical protein
VEVELSLPAWNSDWSVRACCLASAMNKTVMPATMTANSHQRCFQMPTQDVLSGAAGIKKRSGNW